MRSRLLVTSLSNLALLKKYPYLLPLEQFKRIKIVTAPPSKKEKPFNGVVIGLGGGSVIDTAKLIAGKRPCYAIPTNASESCVTSHACIWTKTRKIDVKCPKPILLTSYKLMPIHLSEKSKERTMYDCTCHILESRNSKKANKWSEQCCKRAEMFLLRYCIKDNVNDLIEAGIWAGHAIEITGTNFIHAISYIFTLEQGMCHGDALKEALNIKGRKDWMAIIDRASKRYPKFYESTLI